MRMKDYKGRHVQLRHRIETTGGAVFEKGEVLEVYNTWRGKLNLERVGKLENGCVSSIRGVAKHECDLLPEDPHALVLTALRGALDVADRFGFEVRVDLRAGGLGVVAVDKDQFLLHTKEGPNA